MKKIKYAKNIQSINLKTNKERKGQAKFYPSVTKSVGETLSNYLIDYIKKGGDINNLTPDNVFKKWILIYFIDNYIVIIILYLIKTFFI